MAQHFDDFGDDDLYDLPDNTLNELEQQARLSTQHGTAFATHAGLVEQSLSAGRRHGSSSLRRQETAEDTGESDYDVFDMDIQPSFVRDHVARPFARPTDEVTQRENWRKQRYGQQLQRGQVRKSSERQGSQHLAQAAGSTHRSLHVPMEVDEPKQVANNPDISTFQARIADLEIQAQTFQKAAEDAKSTALSKSGEIAIVRANQAKEAKEFERKLKTLQQQHAEEVAKAKAEIEAIRKEREKYETSNRFLEHDLAREAERARTLKKTLKDGAGSIGGGSHGSLTSTPRKNKMMPFRDGFDDTEVIMLSPSKAKDRSRVPSTPKAGVKRKRPVEESIAGSPALSFAEPEHVLQDEDTSMMPQPATVLISLPRRDGGQEKFELLQMILDHQSAEGRDRTLEALGRFHFPSKARASLASMIYDELDLSATKWNLDQFRLGIADVLISQWKQCLEEIYYEPLYDLTELLYYILVISPASLSTTLTPRTTVLCQKTADIITISIAKASINATLHPLPSRTIRSLIDPMHYLEILHHLAIHAIPTSAKTGQSNSDLVNFWSHMEYDFVLLILHCAQPLSQTQSMLRLLHTSILQGSFSSISSNPSRQMKHESNIVDRLSKWLSEFPEQPMAPDRPVYLTDFLRKKSAEDEEEEKPPDPYSKIEILSLRSDVLELLRALSLNEHGGEILASQPLVIPRLVRCLHESVVDMYKTYSGLVNNAHSGSEVDQVGIGVQQLAKSLNMDEHRIHANHANAIVTILYQLASTYGTLSTPPSSAANSNTSQHPLNLNIPRLLAPLPSSLQRYQVALSRIAFSEPWGMETFIDPDVAEMAHELLDEAVSPEEGAAVLGVFGSGRVAVTY